MIQQIQADSFMVITFKRMRLTSNNLHNLQVLLSYLAEYIKMIFLVGAVLNQVTIN